MKRQATAQTQTFKGSGVGMPGCMQAPCYLVQGLHARNLWACGQGRGEVGARSKAAAPSQDTPGQCEDLSAPSTECWTHPHLSLPNNQNITPPHSQTSPAPKNPGRREGRTQQRRPEEIREQSQRKPSPTGQPAPKFSWRHPPPQALLPCLHQVHLPGLQLRCNAPCIFPAGLLALSLLPLQAPPHVPPFT